jgi:hypothetical protein
MRTNPQRAPEEISRAGAEHVIEITGGGATKAIIRDSTLVLDLCKPTWARYV